MSESWNGGERPEGEPFTEETAAEAGKKTWPSIRRRTLEEHGLWKAWGAVPPADERDDPLETYLPGGENYKEPL